MILQKNSVFRSFFQYTILVLTISTAFFGYYLISNEVREFNRESEKIKTGYIDQQKTLIRDEVLKVFDYIEYSKSLTERRLKQQIRNRVYEAHSIAENIYEENRGRISDEAVQKMVKDALRPIRYNNGRGYYFATDMNGIEQLFADRPEMEGQNLLDMRDTRGKELIKEMISIVRQDGEGFCQYYWTKPNSSRNDYPKLTYVKYFEPFDWFIGTGEYLDDVENDIKQEVLNRIGEIRYGKDGYIFVVSHDGTTLMNGLQKDMIGVDISNMTDSNGVNVFQMEMEAARTENGGYIEYVWEKPKTGIPAPKISFVRGISEWNWIIGAGVYIDDFQAAIAERREILHSSIRYTAGKIIMMYVLFIAVVFLFSKKFTNYMKRHFDVFARFFEKAATEAIVIDKRKLRFSEFKGLADLANRMISDRQHAEDELQESEAKYRLLVENAPVGIITIDTDGNIMEVNKEIITFLGSPSPEETKTINMLTFPALQQAGISQDFRECLKQGTFVSTSRPYISKWNKQVYLRYHIIPLKDADGTIYGAQGVFEDISEQKHLEEQIQIRQKMDSIGTLAGGIAHDFNNLLTGIIGNIDMLRMQSTSLTHEQNEYLNEALISSQRAAVLIQEIQTLSKSAAAEKKAVDIYRIAGDVFSILRKTTDRLIEKNNTIEPNTYFIHANAGQIHQVLLNLGTNSVQAIEERGVKAGDYMKISADAYRAGKDDPHGLAEGEYVHVAFEDNGIGMTEEVRTKAFDPLFSTRSKSTQKGQGLGLAMVYNIVTRTHGGYIDISSEPGNGAVFHLYLQRSTDAEKNDAAKTPVIHNGKETILVVEDEAPVRKFVEKALVKYGYHVLSAPDGDEGLRTYREKQDHIDLVMLDLTMPKMSGETLLHKLIEINENVRVIISSGQSEEVLHGFSSAQGYLKKPYQVNTLLQTVRVVLDG